MMRVWTLSELVQLPLSGLRTPSPKLRVSRTLWSPSRTTASEAMSSKVLPTISLWSLPGESQMGSEYVFPVGEDRYTIWVSLSP
jgi:hypothetical protein